MNAGDITWHLFSAARADYLWRMEKPTVLKEIFCRRSRHFFPVWVITVKKSSLSCMIILDIQSRRIPISRILNSAVLNAADDQPVTAAVIVAVVSWVCGKLLSQLDWLTESDIIFLFPEFYFFLISLPLSNVSWNFLMLLFLFVFWFPLSEK